MFSNVSINFINKITQSSVVFSDFIILDIPFLACHRSKYRSHI